MMIMVIGGGAGQIPGRVQGGPPLTHEKVQGSLREMRVKVMRAEKFSPEEVYAVGDCFLFSFLTDNSNLLLM